MGVAVRYRRDRKRSAMEPNGETAAIRNAGNWRCTKATRVACPGSGRDRSMCICPYLEPFVSLPIGCSGVSLPLPPPPSPPFTTASLLRDASNCPLSADPNDSPLRVLSATPVNGAAIFTGGNGQTGECVPRSVWQHRPMSLLRRARRRRFKAKLS